MRAGAKGGQGEPDPGHFERFCNAVLPDLLTGVCHVSTGLAAQIGADMLARAESYAALDDRARDVLIAPFAEESLVPFGRRGGVKIAGECGSRPAGAAGAQWPG